jgi:hypothetical protein
MSLEEREHGVGRGRDHERLVQIHDIATGRLNPRAAHQLRQRLDGATRAGREDCLTKQSMRERDRNPPG